MKNILIVVTTAYVPTEGLAGVVMNYYRNVDRTGLQIDIASTNEASEMLVNEFVINRNRKTPKVQQ